MVYASKSKQSNKPTNKQTETFHRENPTVIKIETNVVVLTLN